MQSQLLEKEEFTEVETVIYDVNGDGRITAADLAYINAVSLGKVTFAW